MGGWGWTAGKAQSQYVWGTLRFAPGTRQSVLKQLLGTTLRKHLGATCVYARSKSNNSLDGISLDCAAFISISLSSLSAAPSPA